jgi:hypothetical protein
MWNSRLGCLMPGRMPSPQIMDLIKSSFLSVMNYSRGGPDDFEALT